jgi:hypothetical protein
VQRFRKRKSLQKSLQILRQENRTGTVKKARKKRVDARVQLLVPAIMRDALDRMAREQMRSTANLIRKILADHLCNHGLLTRDELWGNADWRLNLQDD